MNGDYPLTDKTITTSVPPPPPASLKAIARQLNVQQTQRVWAGLHTALYNIDRLKDNLNHSNQIEQDLKSEAFINLSNVEQSIMETINTIWPE